MLRANPQANALVFVAMLAFVPLVFALFQSMRPTVAAIVAILAGEMFLPTQAGFDLPGMPPFGKDVYPYLVVLVALATRDARRLSTGRFGTGLEVLGLIFIAGTFGTVLNNGDPLSYGSTILPGLSLLDWLTGAISHLMRFVLPVFLGRILVTRTRDLLALLQWLSVGAVIYSVLALGEVRLSPQFHAWVYGYHAGDFQLAVRYGGYRPMVFMDHGLVLTVFLVVGLFSAAMLRRAKLPVLPLRVPLSGMIARFASPLVMTTLVLCKSIGSAIYGGVGYLAIVVAPLGLIARLSLVLCLLAVAYPLLRSSNVVPTDDIIEYIRGIDEERAHSLWSRFENEDIMLGRARSRVWFGWGSYGREAPLDAETGEQLAATDGFWVITLSAYGVIGFLSLFLIQLVPVWQANRTLSSIADPRARAMLAALTLSVGVRLFDYVPNGFFSCLPLFLAGALQGSLRGIQLEQRSVRATPPRHSARLEREPEQALPRTVRWSDVDKPGEPES